MKKNLGLKVPLKKAEKIRKQLIKNNILKKNLIIKKDKKFIYLPIKKDLINKDLLNDFKIVKSSFEEKEIKKKEYTCFLEIPDKLKDKLPTSYDIIGDIILLKLDDELLDYKNSIGESLIKANKNINTVCLAKPVSGEYRTRNIKVIAGEKKTNTIHKEYGVKYYLDVSKTYFSPRLANERKRIADLVKDDEIVVDMFTGVAPFPIMIAKHSNPKIVYGFDKNKHAIEYAKKNVVKNKLVDKIELFRMDSKKANKILEEKKVFADRIIMNLPFSSLDFFPTALTILSDEGVINYYTILNEDRINSRLQDLKNLAINDDYKIIDARLNTIKTYAPHEFYIGIDITAKKK